MRMRAPMSRLRYSLFATHYSMASRRIRRQGLAREAVASLQDVVDFMSTPDAMSRRIAGSERPLQFQARDFAAPLQGSSETARLTRQIVERIFYGFEPAQEVGGFDLAVFWRVFVCADEVITADCVCAEKRYAGSRAGRFRSADETQARIEKPESRTGVCCAGTNDP